jgi:hypothetical protein
LLLLVVARLGSMPRIDALAALVVALVDVLVQLVVLGVDQHACMLVRLYSAGRLSFAEAYDG